MKWIALYYRHYRLGHEEFDTQEDADRFLELGSNSGDCFEAAVYNPETDTLLMRVPFPSAIPAIEKDCREYIAKMELMQVAK